MVHEIFELLVQHFSAPSGDNNLRNYPPEVNTHNRVFEKDLR
jgi:hypothetical protein